MMLVVMPAADLVDLLEATGTFLALRGEQPDSLAVLRNLGLSLEGQGKIRAAAQAYEDALGRSPADPIFLAALGNMMVLEGRFTAALNSYQRALASPDEFDGRARVETILEALKAMPSTAGVGGLSSASGAD